MAKLKTSKIASNCATTIVKPLVPKPFSFNPNTNILLVPIHVKPNAKESRLESLLSSKRDLVDSLVYAFNMHVAAPPQDGEANVEVIHHTSKAWGLKKSSISIIKGQKSRDKTLAVSITGNVSEFISKIIEPSDINK